MNNKETSESKLSLPQVKEAMASIGEENMDQFQRRTFDYVSKFAKADPADAAMLSEKLVTEYGLDEDEAIQIVNCMPESVDELRAFLTAGRKIIEASKLATIVELLNEKRALK